MKPALEEVRRCIEAGDIDAAIQRIVHRFSEIDARCESLILSSRNAQSGTNALRGLQRIEGLKLELLGEVSEVPGGGDVLLEILNCRLSDKRGNPANAPNVRIALLRRGPIWTTEIRDHIVYLLACDPVYKQRILSIVNAQCDREADTSEGDVGEPVTLLDTSWDIPPATPLLKASEKVHDHRLLDTARALLGDEALAEMPRYLSAHSRHEDAIHIAMAFDSGNHRQILDVARTAWETTARPHAVAAFAVFGKESRQDVLAFLEERLTLGEYEDCSNAADKIELASLRAEAQLHVAAAWLANNETEKASAVSNEIVAGLEKIVEASGDSERPDVLRARLLTLAVTGGCDLLAATKKAREIPSLVLRDGVLKAIATQYIDDAQFDHAQGVIDTMQMINSKKELQARIPVEQLL